VAATVGFPLGAANTAAKQAEAAQAVRDGAHELDMVCAIGALKEGLREAFVEDIRGVLDGADGRAVKVILETSLLGEAEKRRGAEWVREAGAAFVRPRPASAAEGQARRTFGSCARRSGTRSG
jgi:deoxyribose-phosphate aldolase